MNYGFTGTRKGMSRRQREALYAILTGDDLLHDGMCLGADAEAHNIAGERGCERVGHPSTLKGMTADLYPEQIREPLPPLERNHVIVNECDIMIAAPRTMVEEWQGSGTWATIRYANSVGKPLIILVP